MHFLTTAYGQGKVCLSSHTPQSAAGGGAWDRVGPRGMAWDGVGPRGMAWDPRGRVGMEGLGGRDGGPAATARASRGGVTWLRLNLRGDFQHLNSMKPL